MTEVSDPATIDLSAGPLSMVFEPANAMLRCLRYGNVELVRGVFAAVRDQDWNTIPLAIHDLRVNQLPGSCSLSFLAKCEFEEVRFEWRGEITGSPQGVVSFRFHGQAKSTFLRNRIGLCVLHPIQECAGQPCSVEHPDGTTSSGTFPKWISPHQPFKNIRVITHQAAANVRVRVAFEGEVFEMEDQRNWTDASYKTYCTPLDLPFPVEISVGSQIDQSVTIELLGEVSSKAKSHALAVDSDAPIHVGVDWQTMQPLPPIGLSMATCREAATPEVIERLRELKLSHVRVDVRLDRDDWQEKLRAACELASLGNTKLEIALFTCEVGDAAWQRCLQQLHPHGYKIARWLVFHSTAKATPESIATGARNSLLEFSPGIPLVVGTNTYFAELNRNRPTMPDDCHVCYSINPQVHAFDNLSLCETLQAQPWTVDSAVHYLGMPVVVSPITLRPRFNPNATSTTKGNEIPEPESDARQSSGFAAAWTVGALAQLAVHPKVASLTFYETYGPRGIMSSSGADYAMTDIFEIVQQCDSVYPTTNSSILQVAALALQTGAGQRRLLLANLSQRQQTVCVKEIDGRTLQFLLDAESVRLVTLEGSS